MTLPIFSSFREQRGARLGHRRSQPSPSLLVVALAFAAMSVGLAAPAFAQRAAQVQYQRVLVREQTLRSASVTSVTTARVIAKAYEDLVRAHPVSGYADNALWQGAGVLELAFARSKDVRDRNNAVRLLAWLRKEYPTSAYAKRVDSRLQALNGSVSSPTESTAGSAARSVGSTGPIVPTGTTGSSSLAGSVGSTTSTAVPKAGGAPAATSPASPPTTAIPTAAPAPVPAPPSRQSPAPAASTATVLDAPLWETPVVSKPLPTPAPSPTAAPSFASPKTSPTVSPVASISADPVVRDGGVSVRSITRMALPKGDRVILELNREATYSAARVQNPDRVLFDVLNASALPVITGQASAVSTSLLKSINVGTTQTGAVRLAIELNGKPRFTTFPLYDPFRLVIDFESDSTAEADGEMDDVASTGRPAQRTVRNATGSSGGALKASSPRATVPSSVASATVTPIALASAASSASAGASGSEAPAGSVRNSPTVTGATPPASSLMTSAAPVAPAATAKGDYSIARQLGLGISRIVIDPGHGGHDPGASGNGVAEADLVLDVALRLERLLRDRPGMDVVLTRRTDEYVALEQRTAIANREEADMFLSIHANAGRQGARGVETYFLDMATTPAAQLVAARENAPSRKTMAVLPDIVRAIALNNKLAESRELASVVQASLVRRLPGPSGASKDLGVKQAPFEVLVGAKMPSVLAEIAFLTNKTDAALLKQAAYRQRIAQALCDAVVKYQTSLKKVETVAARTEAQ